MSFILETKELTKRFPARIAVNSLNLQVERGDVFGFLGQNGAGKSTTIRMLLGLVKPSSGQITLRGLDLLHNRETALRRVGAIVEAPAFYDYLTGWENLRILSSLSGGVLHSRIREVLRLVHLSGREQDKVRIYSHGMRQRLGLAQALLPRPELLILDEPTDGLDPQGIREIRQVLLDLSKNQGITIFLSSHLLHEVERTCNRIAILNEGKLLYQGLVSRLLEAQRQYKIKIDRPVEALRFLSSCPNLRIFRNGDDHLYLELCEHEISAVNQALVNQGFRVSEISRHLQSLEDIYFRLTS